MADRRLSQRWLAHVDTRGQGSADALAGRRLDSKLDELDRATDEFIAELTRTPQDEKAYQGLWCLYLTAHPYFLDTPSDVACGFEPRAMTGEEAAAHFLESMRPLVEVMDRWDCADSQAKGGMTWYYERTWARRSQEADRRWGDALAAVRWPDDVARTAARLTDDLYAEADRREEAYRYDTFTESLSSGDWSRSLMASDQRGEAAEDLRVRLRFA